MGIERCELGSKCLLFCIIVSVYIIEKANLLAGQEVNTKQKVPKLRAVSILPKRHYTLVLFDFLLTTKEEMMGRDLLRPIQYYKSTTRKRRELSANVSSVEWSVTLLQSHSM